jgi:hypothetical protein
LQLSFKEADLSPLCRSSEDDGEDEAPSAVVAEVEARCYAQAEISLEATKGKLKFNKRWDIKVRW